MTCKTSGFGTKDIQVQILDIYLYLTWLGQYIQPRDTLHNMDQEEPENNMYDYINTYALDDNASLASSVSATGSNSWSVTGRQNYRKTVR